MFDIVFFDLDGTLVDSKPGVLISIKYALNKMNWEIPADSILNCFIGPPLMESFPKYCNMTEEEAWKATNLYREYYVGKEGLFDGNVYDGVEDMLKKLNDAGKRVIVATAKPEEMAVSVLDHFGLSKYFEYIAGAAMDEKSRNTKSAVIKYALERGKITDLSKVVMVGDRSNDMEGAAENGIKALGILYGYGSREELERAGADMIAATPAEAVRTVIS